MLSFIYKFHFILYKFFQSFSEIKRKRDWDSERELERKTLREGRTAGGSKSSNEHRSPEQRQRHRGRAMSRWRCLRCWSAIHFRFNFSEIKSERLRESQREKERNTLREGQREHRAASTEHRSRGRAICVLRSPICDEGWPGERWRRRRRRRDRPWVTGFGFGLCIGDFFFFW